MKYADVTLVSEDNIQVKAHKAVLGASSPFLSNLFLTHSEPQPVAFMKGIRCKELRAVLEFMYVGRVKVLTKSLEEIMNILQDLQLPEIIYKKPKVKGPLKSKYFDSKKVDGMGTEIPEFDAIHIQLKGTEIVEIMEMENEKIQCNECDKEYKARRELNRHIKEKHEGIKYACDQCNYNATQRSSLKMHKRNSHDGIKFFCDACDYKSGQLNNVTRHKQYKHEGVRYPCDQCEYQATTNGSLKQHVKKKHEGSNTAFEGMTSIM